ncbi:MAG: B12-binding domain-containing radical SAM protein [Magnetococcales bacterium]|nr:B12-binding domain-containing radical SAM protein [Magnetococcales bacterium]
MILLTTFNARFTHASLGLRCVMANLGPLREQAGIVEFDLETRPEEAVERLLLARPRIVGCGVHVWNTDPTTRMARLLKRLRPEVILVLGGPETGHGLDDHPLGELADHLIVGEGELAFRELAAAILAGTPPTEKKIIAKPPDLRQIALPYAEYTDADLAHRQIYVEASRGCAWQCVFCLSALDAKVRRFPLPALLAGLERLHARGARRFKFVDRIFNTHREQAALILDFFLDPARAGAFLHFEMIPDLLPEAIRQRLAAFPPGAVQLELGVQSFDPVVLNAIRRRQDPDRAAANLSWLRNATRVHLHTDLIVGLPGESLAGFAAGFDRLVALAPHEIQVGILKRLAGTPLTAMEAAHGYLFNPDPPYELLANDRIDFFTMRRMKRFARYWDLIGNSGRFASTLALAFRDGSPFAVFLLLSDRLFAIAGETHAIALPRLFSLVGECLTGQEGIEAALEADRRRAERSVRPARATPPRQQRALGSFSSC